jgi:hypothetical protein
MGEEISSGTPITFYQTALVISHKTWNFNKRPLNISKFTVYWLRFSPRKADNEKDPVITFSLACLNQFSSKHTTLTTWWEQNQFQTERECKNKDKVLKPSASA